MKLTNATGTYAKRINSLIRLFWIYFGSTESATREAVSHAAGLVRYFKANRIYFAEATKKIVADTRIDPGCCNIELETYIENGSVMAKDNITLHFPALSEVLYTELITSKDQQAYREKYGDFLK